MHLLQKGEDPGEAARSSGAAILGIAGGDGSLATVASVALATDAAFVCVPFGTRNHFARDVGLDRDDPFAAARRAHRRRRAPHRRRPLGGRLFPLARIRGLLQVARHRHRLHARVNGEEVDARVLLVGNNRYDLSLFTVGERERLDEGLLQLWVAARLRVAAGVGYACSFRREPARASR